MSVSDVGSVTPLSKGVSTQSVNGNNQVVSLDGGVSTMGSSGGITCYKAACSSGYYLDAPNSTYFTSTSTTGTIGLTCYKATGCKSGYYNGGSSYDYHGYKCSKCTYSCPSLYYTSAGTGYHLRYTKFKYQVCNGDSSKTNSIKCYQRVANTCSSEGYVDSCPSGQSGTPVTINSGSSTKTCYKDCKDNYYSCDGSAGATNDCYTWHCEFDEAHKSQVQGCNYDSNYCTIDGGSSWCDDPCDGVICGPGQHCMKEGTLRGQCCFHDVWGDFVISSDSPTEAETTCRHNGYLGYEWIKMNCPNETTIQYIVYCRRV